MVEPPDQSDRIDSERRTLLQSVAGLGAAGLLGGASVGSAGAVTTGGWDWFGGLEHTALGSAEPTLENGSLVVPGLDDTGESGVGVGLGEAGGITVNTTLDPSVPVDSYREFRNRGVVNGESGVGIGRFRTVRTDSPNGFAVEPNFENLGSGSYTFEVYDRGDRVGRVEEATDPSYIPDRDVEFEIKIVVIWTDAGPIIKIVIVGIEDPIIGPRMDEYVGDEIRIRPENLDAVPDAATGLDVVGVGREQFTIDDEAVHAVGRPHRRLGNARFDPVNLGSSLGVGNVGSSGEDGFGIDLDGVQSFEFEYRDLDLTVEGAVLEGYYFGPYGGWPIGPPPVASLTNVGGELEIRADFTEVGSEAVHARVFEGNDIVGETTLEAGVVGTMPAEFVDGWCGSDGDPPGIEFRPGDGGDPVPLPFAFADGTELEGDRLRLSPVNPTEDLSGLSEFGARVANVEPFGIVNETL
ncbi:hypothetical protein [Halorussus caseinilyticus]|uniref:Uncharacterized protein n=1 Tax=Halorussus caseinilyticus TaxID=3034025 RepID=A0ABD5WPC2_9EURY|nr:hypothetical protein [Halorussus sp. DT72]